MQSFAFVAPRNLTITAISSAAVGQSVTADNPGITAQIYTAPINSTDFTPIAGASVSYTAPASNASNGSTANVNISIPVNTRILMVVYATSTATSGTVNVFLNGSIAIT
ncbi:hypothetical protein [Lachnoclostridium phytofermentans]|uniref:hypothetical protein n=1 Tax=Lachnoclostridium phytofermentans TaxID=66219 RepID=UPI00068F0C69|nr:hypothetical protein [Lachnoclostridium phytofermentans]